MKNSDYPDDKANFLATFGMLFFGVPNTGMNINHLRPMVTGRPNESFILNLAQNTESLRILSRAFRESFDFDDSEIILFFETEYTPIPAYVSIFEESACRKYN